MRLPVSFLLASVLAAQQPAPTLNDVAKVLRGKPDTSPTGPPAPTSTHKPATIKGNISALANEPTSLGARKVDYLPGEPLPAIPCTDGRLCEILLEPGEIIPDLADRNKGAPILADSIHWTYFVRVSGAGKDARLSLVAKVIDHPIGLLSTDLLINTDRREYHLTLDYDSHSYVPRTEFRYPADEARQAVIAYANEQLRMKHEQDFANTIPAHIVNRRYQLIVAKGTPARLIPTAVSDDGDKTTIVFPPDLVKWDTPFLTVANMNGCEVADYHTAGATWTYRGLFDEALITLGSGKHAKRVRIFRGASDKLPPHTCGPAIKGHTVNLGGAE